LTGELNQLVADTRALGEVVEDLLVSAEAQHRRPPATPVDLVGLAGEVVASMAAYADSRQVVLDVEASEPVTVHGAPAALRRAVTALVDNAIGHVPPGGRVVVRVEHRGRWARLSVTDNGVGLDPAETGRLFDRFARGDGGTGRRFGLGLALVLDVATAHAGSVQVTGAPGKGATFTLALPIARVADAAADAATAADAAVGGAVRGDDVQENR
jgi:signal transduction histidine kinase